MVAAQYAYSKGRTFMRRMSTAFAVLFGLFVLFFTAPPKLWSGVASQDMFANSFTQNIAHADTPHTGDSTIGDGGTGGTGGDCGTDSGAGGGSCGCF